ncbi:hypothetical protein QAD02_018901 [Eretmocerus hayati]|uniref:Uncharacterized protein n=1 Tax=Eretmocerus hayati TaxID=131215 RepID=A0ACC2PHN8_9HYME|nr:hypothetical protein QAD02_018901 [Eretmocerus hayati]
MNDFQNIGVSLQLVGMIILLLKILCTLNCTGISGKTQILHALVFTTRFMDLQDEFRMSLPSFILKIVYLSVIYLTVLSIFVICRSTYEREHDTFRYELLIGACTLMSLLASYKNLELLRILWYFSIFLEAFAIFPQFHMTEQARYAGSSLVFYVGMLACYRGFYIVHWAYLIFYHGKLENCLVTLAGGAQFLIYCVYFVWMVPIFKAQYPHHLHVDSGDNGQLVVMQTMIIAPPSCNGCNSGDVNKAADESDVSLGNYKRLPTEEDRRSVLKV